MKEKFSKFSRKMTTMSGKPIVFIGALLLIAGWLLTGFYFHWSDSHSLFINTVTTIITFLMVFLIQHTQNRDTEALQIKIDELIRAIKEADNKVLNLEELDDRELDKKREEYLKLALKARGEDEIIEDEIKEKAEKKEGD